MREGGRAEAIEWEIGRVWSGEDSGEWEWTWEEVEGVEGEGGREEWGRSGKAARLLDSGAEDGQYKLPFFFTDPTEWNGGAEGGGEGEGPGEGRDFVIPTFGEVVDALAADVWRAPPPFRTLANMCGARHSALDAVIPFERLEVICCAYVFDTA